MVRGMGQNVTGNYYGSLAGLTTLALLEHISAMQNPKHAQQLEDEVTTGNRAARFMFWHGNTRSEIPIPPEWRASYPLVLDAVSKALNFGAVHRDGDWYDRVHGFIKDMLSSHVENSTMESLKHGINDAYNPVQGLPPALSAIALPSGVTPRFDVAKMFNDYVDHNFSGKSVTAPVSKEAVLPNQQAGDSALGEQNGRTLVNALGSLLGLAGSSASELYNVRSYYQQTHDLMHSIGLAARDWAQNARDLNPQFNGLLWQNENRISTNTPLIEDTRRSWDKLSQVTGERAAERQSGTTGGGRYAQPVPQIGQPKFPLQDPTMDNMFQTTDRYRQYLETNYMGPINALRKQMAAINEQAIEPREKRTQLNDKTRELDSLYRLLHDRIDDLNAELSHVVSNKVGAPRSVNIRSIDWGKGLEQFH
jgi:hypothetical protein